MGPLITTLKDEHPGVREMAGWALKKITGRRLGENPIKWQEWWEQNKSWAMEHEGNIHN